MTAHSLIGVDLGGTHMRAGRVEQQSIVDLATRPTPVTTEADIVVADLIATIRQVLTSETSAIGIGVPSVVDVEQGIVYDAPNIPSWREVHLKRALEVQFQLPVHINNDANCFALGEYHFGKGQGARSLVGLIIGTGVGAGLILDGHLYSGVNCGAGEIGMIPYRDHTYEYYASGPRFQREWGRSGSDLYVAAQRGEAEPLAIFHTFGLDVAKVITVALHAFDPDRIILGGSVSRAYPFFKEAVWEGLKSFSYPQSLKHLAIEMSEEPEIAILGAAGLCLDVFNR